VADLTSPELTARIHRGAHEIGGSCVELRSGDATIILDLGTPLTSRPGQLTPLPQAVGPGAEGTAPLGVFITHGHQDHWGLVPQLPPGIPLFVGQGAANVLRAAQFWGTGVDLGETGHLTHLEPVRLGPFTVTPYLADHSGYDAYSLLVEAGGRRLLYTGDLRGHGRKAAMFDRLLAGPPAPVHALLMEGTSFRAAELPGAGPSAQKTPTPVPTEADLENSIAETIRGTDGLVVVLASAQNIDRLVTVYRSALRAERDLSWTSTPPTSPPPPAGRASRGRDPTGPACTSTFPCGNGCASRTTASSGALPGFANTACMPSSCVPGEADWCSSARTRARYPGCCEKDCSRAARSCGPCGTATCTKPAGCDFRRH